MRKGGVAAATLAGSLALACSACGGGSTSAASHAASHGKHHAPITSTTARPTSSTTTPSGLARCTDSQLSISVGQTGAGLGHEGATIVFVNNGTSTCTLSGYPGIAALSASGAQVQQARRTPSGYLGGLETGSATPPVVDLQVGVAASALVEGTDVPVGTATSCPTYPALLVTPPTSTQSKRLTVSLPGCSPLQVHPFVSGVTGST